MVCVSRPATICCLLLAGAAAAPSALEQARALRSPSVQLIEGGEFEDDSFWSSNELLLQQAWQQYGRKHESLYTFSDHFEQLYITPEMRAAVAAARSEKQERSLHTLFEIAAPSVTGTKHLFTARFRQHLVEELDWLRKAGIPQRRPNGMNRFGSILSEAPGSLGFNDMIQQLTAAYLTPIALSLFPEAAVRPDVNESYAFIIRYKQGEDVSLKEHADASVVTLNLCLLKQDTTTADSYDLKFEPLVPYGSERSSHVTQPASMMRFEPGDGLFHLGQHRHSAVKLLEGERINLIIWLHGKWGVVRVMPYKPHEAMSVHERWALETDVGGQWGGALPSNLRTSKKQERRADDL